LELSFRGNIVKGIEVLRYSRTGRKTYQYWMQL
jgi:hypothetical protein